MAIDERQITATIASGQSLSAEVNLGAGRLFAISMPSAWTTAALTFQGSFDSETFYDLYDEEGTEVTVDAAASRFILIDPNKWFGLRTLKIRSGTTGTPVNQGAARVLNLISIS